MRAWLMRGVLALLVVGGCDDGPAGTAEPAVARVELAAASLQVTVGDSLVLTATPRGAGGEALSEPIVWRTLNAAIAELHGTGTTVRVAGKSAGTVRIEAESGGRVAYVNITVAAPPAVAAVEIAPATVWLEVGQQVSLQALARAADSTVLAGRAAAWSVAEGNSATIAAEATPGRATVHAVAEGQSLVRVVVDGHAAEATIVVVPPGTAGGVVATVTLTPAAFSLPIDHETSLQAIARTANGALVLGRTATWSVAPGNVVFLSPYGLADGFGHVTASQPGTAVITVTVDGVSATATVQVPDTATPPPQVTSLAFATPHHGLWEGYDSPFAHDLRAVGPNGPVANPAVTWSVADTLVATVDATGVVHGVRPGTTLLRAQAGAVEAVTRVTVFPYLNGGVHELTWDWWDNEYHLLPEVGTGTWTDGQGVERSVALYPVRGTIRILGDGTYERVLELEGWATVDGVGRKVVERTVVDQGTTSLIVGGETGYRMVSSTTPGYEYVVVGWREVGHLVMRGTVGTAPAQEYLFRLRL